jgi:hypothetical protein
MTLSDWFWLSYVCPLIVSLPMVFKYFCSDCGTWWRLFQKRIVRTKCFIILLLVLVEDQLSPSTNYRHPQTPEKVWTNFWKRHLWQVESWTTKLYVCAFDFKTWSEPINIYIKNMGGITWTYNLKITTGHVERETLPQHLQNHLLQILAVY